MIFKSVNFFSDLEVVLSTWSGKYTCNNNGSAMELKLNVTDRSSSQVDADIQIDGASIAVTGQFYGSLSVIILSSGGIWNTVYGQNLTKINIEGKMLSSASISGAIRLATAGGNSRCDLQLDRTSGSVLKKIIISQKLKIFFLVAYLRIFHLLKKNLCL